jgi:hypothetical protein
VAAAAARHPIRPAGSADGTVVFSCLFWYKQTLFRATFKGFSG